MIVRFAATAPQRTGAVMNTLAVNTIVTLAEKFSATFAVYEGRRKPLKIGIFADLLIATAIDPAELKEALRLYCSNAGYLRACSAPGAVRVDLNGGAAGQVTDELAERAAARLAKQKERQKKRRIARAWKEAWERRAAAKPAPTPKPELETETPEPAEVPRSELTPVRRGDGFNALREAARARKAALTKLEENGAQADSCAHSG